MARKRRVKTITLFPNPYHCMGAAGALGGAAPLPEAFHGGALPARLYIGAERKHENFIPGHKDGEKASRSDRFFLFDCVAKTYEVAQGTRADFENLIRDGVVFRVKSEDEIPVEKLAAARLALVVDHADHHTDEDPDFEFWAEQFPIDTEIAKLTEEPLKAALARIAKRAEEARTLSENPPTDHEKAEAARIAREKFVGEAQARAAAAIAAVMTLKAEAKSAAPTGAATTPPAPPVAEPHAPATASAATEPVAAEKPQKRAPAAPKE